MFFTTLFVIYEVLSCCNSSAFAGILYPRESESREVRSLDGLWEFSTTPPPESLQAYTQQWFGKLGMSKMLMPVPASYNDITEDKKLRDYVGAVWYQKNFYVPKSWSKNQRVWIRFGSICYSAEVVSYT